MSRKVYLVATSLCALGLLLSGQRPPRATAHWLPGGGPRELMQDQALEQRVRSALRGAPLQFEENVGQANGPAKFVARGANFVLALAPQEADLTIHTRRRREKQPPQLELEGVGWADAMAASALVRVEFAGGSQATKLTGFGAEPGTINYIQGSDPKNWQRNVPHFSRVRYQGIYPGVDAVFYGGRRQMEFDFEVAPGADPSAIRMHVEGANSVELNEDGGLEARTTAGVVSLLAPKLYQKGGDGRPEIAGRYVWRAPGEIGFEVADYDHSQALVIDPQTTVRQAGRRQSLARQAGRNRPKGQPGPPDSPQPTGDSVALSTLLGGSGDDSIQAMAIAQTEAAPSHTYVYVTGFTDSINTAYNRDFPLVGPGAQNGSTGPGGTPEIGCQIPQSPCGDAFVAEFDVTTRTNPTLVSTTFLGGSNDDVAWGLALDSNFDPYIVGQTDSADFPTTENAYQGSLPNNSGCGTPSQPRACHHVFFSVLSSDLSQLLYSTYLAGADDDEGYAVAVDASGNAYLTGAAGEYFPAYYFECGVVFQCDYNGGGDAFAAEIANPGCPDCSGSGQLTFATYLGGYETDAGLAIAVDSASPPNVFVGGVTYSTQDDSFLEPPGSQGFAITEGSLQSETIDTSFCGPGGVFTCGDGFIVEFSGYGSAVEYGTYLGGSDADQVNGIALDGFGDLYATGQTRSSDFQPVSDCDESCEGSPVQNNNFGGYDAFVVSFYYGCQPDGCDGASEILYATYLGGGNDDIGLGIAIDANGDAFITGSTASGPYSDPGFNPVKPLQAQTNAGSYYNPNSNTVYPSTSFVAAIDTINGNLLFSTYYGGLYDYYGNAPTDAGTSIALDSAGEIYVAGQTTSYATVDNSIQSYYGTPGLCLINQVPGADQDASYTTDYNGFLLIINPQDSGAACFSPALATAGTPLTFTFPGTLSNAPTQPYPPSPQVLTMYNQGSAALESTITFTNLVNANAGDFSETESPACTGMANPLAGGGASCQIIVRFLPTISTAGGPVTESATMVIQNTNGNCPTATSCTLQLAGTALPPANPVTLAAATTATFPSTAVGSTSVPMIFNFINNSPTTYADVSSVAFNPTTSDYQIFYDFCTGTQVQANGGSCSIYVTFTPQGTGMRTATLQVTDDGATNPTLTLMGTGTTPTGNAPTAGITTVNLNFAPQGQGTTSGTQIVTLTNTGATGSSSLTIQPLSFMGTNAADFTIVAASTTCSPSAPVAVGSSCNIGVAFAPNAPDTGALTAMLVITSNATNSPQTVNVMGTALGPPTATPSTGTVTFPSQVMSTTSAPMNVMLTNSGGSPLSISNIALTGGNLGDFAIFSNGCGTSLSPGGNCIVALTFTPTATGARTTTLQFTDNAGNSPQNVTVNGTGAAGPNAALTPPTVTFATAQVVNTTSGSMPATLTNSGGAALSITSVAASGDFAVLSSTCGISLAANSNCQINVTFTPTAAGTRNGMLTVMDAVGTQIINLTGTGVTPPTAGLSTNNVQFGTQAVGVTSSAMQVTLTNSGGSTLNVSAIAPTGDFAEADNCQPAVQAGTMCTINITFTPSGVGQRNGSLLIVDNAAGSPQTIMLSGTGSSNVPGFNIAAPLYFGAVLVGSTSSAQMVTITNAGGAPLVISSVMASTQFGVASNNCGTVNIGLSCMIGVTFSPTAVGTQNGTLTIMDNAPGSPHTVSLSGVGATISMAPPPGGTTTLTVTAGDTAQYNLSVTGTQGLVVTLNLTCVSSAPYTRCSVSPSTLTLGGPTPPTVLVTVLTNCNPSFVVGPRKWPPPVLPAPFLGLWLGTIVLFVLLRRLAPDSWLTRAAPALVVLLLVITWAGCVSNPPPAIPGSPTTPAGTYAVTISANGMNVSQNVQFVLRVI